MENGKLRNGNTYIHIEMRCIPRKYARDGTSVIKKNKKVELFCSLFFFFAEQSSFAISSQSQCDIIV